MRGVVCEELPRWASEDDKQFLEMPQIACQTATFWISMRSLLENTPASPTFCRAHRQEGELAGLAYSLKLNRP